MPVMKNLKYINNRCDMKKIIRAALLPLVVVLAFCSCTKYEKVGGGGNDGEKVFDILTADNFAVNAGEKNVFKIGRSQDGYRWLLDGREVSTASTYEFTPVKQGTYAITLETSAGKYECSVDVLRPVTDNSSKWISDIVEYRPAPGQFINTSSWGTYERARSIIGEQPELGERGGVSLGGFGGYIIFKFDHTVVNQNGYDFVIRGNAFDGSSEPGAVMVAFDRNGNGVPDDDEWYELAGETYNPASGGYEYTVKKNFTVTYTRPDDISKAVDVSWSASDGTSGYIYANVFHSQPYWPLFVDGDPAHMTFTGTCLSNLSIDRSEEMGMEGEYWYSAAAGKGYADNYSEEYDDIVNLDPQTARSNKFDISNAVDAQGNKVRLSGADFIKVYTCINQSSGWLGEGSTEVCGAISLTSGPLSGQSAPYASGEGSTEVCGALSLSAKK